MAIDLTPTSIKDSVIRSCRYSSLATMLSDASVDGKQLLIVDSEITIATNTTLHSTDLHVVVSPGGSFTITSGAVLSIACSLEAGPYKIFNIVSGSVIETGTGKTNIVRPEWWGALADGNLYTDATLATANDDTVAIQAALNFFQGRAQDNGGEVHFRPRPYKFTAPLSWTNAVALVGAAGAKKRFGLQGSLLVARPSGDVSDPMIEMAAGDPAAGYGIARAEHIGIVGDDGYGDHAKCGVKTTQAMHHINDFAVQGFAETNLEMNYAVTSHLGHIELAGPGCNLKLSASTVGTTCTVDELYCANSNLEGRQAIEIDNQANVRFTHLVLESCYQDAVRLDNVAMAQFDHVYAEDCRGNLFKAGFTTLVRDLHIGPMVVYGTTNALSKATDYVSLDKVTFAHVDIGATLSGIKASYVRTTANTGRVWLKCPVNSTLPITADARVSLTAYAVGDTISVPEDDGIRTVPRTLVFVCTTAGTTAAANPGTYTWGASAVTDGDAVFAQAGENVIAATCKSTELEVDPTYNAALSLPLMSFYGDQRSTRWAAGVLNTLGAEEFQIQHWISGGDGEALVAGLPRDVTGGGGVRVASTDYSTTHKIKIGHEVEIAGEAGLKILGADPPAATGLCQVYAKSDGLYIRLPGGAAKKVTLDT